MPAKTKPMAPKLYTAAAGHVCPACRGENISAGSFDAEGSHAWCEVTCESCGATWNDTYKLTGYVDLRLP